jgi:hypothetical protein
MNATKEFQKVVDRLAEPKPLWQMDVRHRLDLSPNKTDVISRLLFAALYAAEDEEQFLEMLEEHRDQLQLAINVMRLREHAEAMKGAAAK